MLFLGSVEEELHTATPEEQGHLVFTALQRGFLKLDWKRCEAVITLLGGWRINPDSASAEVELMQCQPVFTERREVEEQQEDRRQQTGSTGGGGGERGGGQRGWRRTESWGAEGAGRRTGEGGDGREAPTSAVTTTRLAAVAADCDCCSNKADSCHKHLLLNMTHTCTLTYGHAHTHTDTRTQNGLISLRCLVAALLYGTLSSCLLVSCSLISLRPLWLPSALCKAWQLNHSSNQDVPLIMTEYLCPPSHTLSPCHSLARCMFWGPSCFSSQLKRNIIITTFNLAMPVNNLINVQFTLLLFVQKRKRYLCMWLRWKTTVTPVSLIELLSLSTHREFICK